MKRQRGGTLFFWGRTDNTRTTAKRFKDDDMDDTECKIVQDNPQIELFLKEATHYRDCMPVPYEILLKIAEYVLMASENPLRDLYSMARVCETWRQIIITSPSLWARIDLSRLPKTDRNISILYRIFKAVPRIEGSIREVSIAGSLECKSTKSTDFIEALVSSPNLEKLNLRDLNSKNGSPTLLIRSIPKAKQLQELSITGSRCIFNNQKWLADHLQENGKELECLNLAMSLTTISAVLFKSLSLNYCPRLKVLDISTCDALTTHSFDAKLLTQTMPNLEVLRVANISFKRIHEPPEKFGLVNLRELSMPIGLRDADRDDALFATLTFGSDKIKTLDLRGSTISADALIEMPSYSVRELHIDDLCPLQRLKYSQVIKKWASSLEILSLVKVNCSETVKRCLLALEGEGCRTKLREIDLSSSDIMSADLKRFLNEAKSLNSINLSSCRSLPRGCKGLYSRKPLDRSTQKLTVLKQRLS